MAIQRMSAFSKTATGINISLAPNVVLCGGLALTIDLVRCLLAVRSG